MNALLTQKKKPKNSTTEKPSEPETVEVTVAEYAEATGVTRNAIYNIIRRLRSGDGGHDFPSGVEYKQYDLPTGAHITLVVDKDSRTYQRFVKKIA